MDQGITLDSLRKMAEGSGLKLSEEELKRLLPGVNRAKQQAAELRELIAAPDEPASTFDMASSARK
jgi:hypothetical protein